MAISTYSELQTALENWVDRDDLDSRYPEFIALAEGEMNLVLRTRRNTATATVSVATDGTADVPAGFLALRTVKLPDSPYSDLESVSLDRLSELQAHSVETGNPQVVAVRGDELVFWPAPSSAVDAFVTYYRTIPALADDNTTNWVLTAYPQAYLSGALFEAFSYMDDDEALKHKARFEQAMQRINVSLGLDNYGDSATMLMEATTP